jgi:hypothetical protein
VILCDTSTAEQSSSLDRPLATRPDRANHSSRHSLLAHSQHPLATGLPRIVLVSLPSSLAPRLVQREAAQHHDIPQPRPCPRARPRGRHHHRAVYITPTIPFKV